MKPGLILTHTSTLENGMKFFDGALWLPDRGAMSAIAHLCKNRADAVQHFIRYYAKTTTTPATTNIAWLSGPAATPRLAKKFNLEYRKRAPGGGRKALPEDADHTDNRVSLWLTKAGKADLVAAKKQLKVKSFGIAVAVMSKRTLENKT
jgi:hypothetical protein